MKSAVLRVLTFLTITFVLQPAQGQEMTSGDFLVAPSLLYYSGLRSRTSKDEKAYLVGEMKLAYQIHPFVYLGPTYQHEQDDTKTSGYSSPSLNNTSKSQRSSIGASLGYVTPSYHFMFTYYFDSKWNLNTSSTTGDNKYNYKGTGMQLDVGYKIPLWGIFFGPQLSYKMFTYEKLSTDSGAAEKISPKLEDTGLEPSLVLFYFF